MVQETMTQVRMPKLTSIQKAIEIYHSTFYLSNSDISELFETVSASSINKLKKVVKEYSMNVCSECGYEKSVENCRGCKKSQRYATTQSGYEVNTKQAYEAWGFDIDDLEKRMSKLQKYSIEKR